MSLSFRANYKWYPAKITSVNGPSKLAVDLPPIYQWWCGGRVAAQEPVLGNGLAQIHPLTRTEQTPISQTWVNKCITRAVF